MQRTFYGCAVFASASPLEAPFFRVDELNSSPNGRTEFELVELDAASSCEEALQAICEVATRGSNIVRHLMIYAGRESATMGPVDLSKIVDERLSLLKVSVTRRAVIETHLDQDLPATSAGQLRQIVMNLITNASDAIADRDGVIRVITNPRATDLAWPSYRELCAVSAARSIWRANRTRGLQLRRRTEGLAISASRRSGRGR